MSGFSGLGKVAGEVRQRFSRQTGQAGGVGGYVAALVGGVFLGGVALALLNRHTLERLQEQASALPPPPGSDEIY